MRWSVVSDVTLFTVKIIPPLFAHGQQHLPTDAPCSAFLDWWGAQSLFTFLGADETMLPGTAFGLDWNHYEQIAEGAELSRTALSPLSEEGRRNLELDRKALAAVLHDDLRVLHDGFLPQPLVERLRATADVEVLNYAFSGVDQQILIGDMVYFRSGVPQGSGQKWGWRRLHRFFCFEVLENLLLLLVRVVGTTGFFMHEQERGEFVNLVGGDLDRRQVLAWDFHRLLAKAQQHLVVLASMASFEFPAEDPRVGVRPQLLKPILATLAYVARKRRDERFRELCEEQMEERQTSNADGAGGMPKVVDVSVVQGRIISERTHEVCHSDTTLDPASSTPSKNGNKELCEDARCLFLTRCCEALLGAEGLLVYDAWRAYVRSEPLHRALRARLLYTVERQGLWLSREFHVRSIELCGSNA